MRIVRIFGGLGNQMFQYALAVALKCRFAGEKIYIDRSVIRGYSLHNGFELERIFNTDIPQATTIDILKVAYPVPHHRLWQIGRHLLPSRSSMLVEKVYRGFLPEVFDRKAGCLYDGYWQSEKYFMNCADEVRRAFRFPAFETGSRNEALLKRMAGRTVVSLHVRRCDYMNIASAAAICTPEYYRCAVEHIRECCHPDLFLVFSDDIGWCRDNLKNIIGETAVEYVDWNHGTDSFRDMQLMSMCNHNIVANSSFSWWGAWLNQCPEKIVVVPSRWMSDGDWSDIIPLSWHKIAVE